MSFPVTFADFAGMASSILNGFEGLAHWAAPAAVAGVWQGAAVAAGLVICLRLAPRVSATHRFVAWVAGFGVAAGLPLLPTAIHMLLEDGTTQGSVTVAGASAWLTLDARWSLVIAGLWLGLSAYRVAGLAIHSLRLRRLWKSARPITSRPISARAVAAGQVGNGAMPWSATGRLRARTVEICSTRELDRPSVIGFFAPRILIPEWLLERLTRDELDQVILHESEHLRRGDDWTNLTQKLCLALFPLNPALVWMDRRLSKEREMACDEGVVRRTRAPRAYAACLTSLAERGLEKRVAPGYERRAEALSLGAFERRPELVRRVHSILEGKMLSPIAGRALVGVVGCGLLFGSVELARCPQTVAFVAEPTMAAMAAPGDLAQRATEPSAVRADYAVARGSDGFRAMNTMATAPAGLNDGTNRGRATPRKAVEHRDTQSGLKTAARETSANHPHEVLSMAQVASAAAQQPQEWLVVTTWQVQTAYRAQNVADYDDGQAAATNAMAKTTDADSSNQVAKRDSSGAHMAVTRMILGVYRASQTAQSTVQGDPQAGAAAAKTTAPAANNLGLKSTGLKSPAGQPGARTLSAVPFGDGWLVIQL